MPQSSQRKRRVPGSWTDTVQIEQQSVAVGARLDAGGLLETMGRASTQSILAAKISGHGATNLWNTQIFGICFIWSEGLFFCYGVYVFFSKTGCTRVFMFLDVVRPASEN
jgi:hypothetical protein